MSETRKRVKEPVERGIRSHSEQPAQQSESPEDIRISVSSQCHSDDREKEGEDPCVKACFPIVAEIRPGSSFHMVSVKIGHQ